VESSATSRNPKKEVIAQYHRKAFPWNDGQSRNSASSAGQKKNLVGPGKLLCEGIGSDSRGNHHGRLMALRESDVQGEIRHFCKEETSLDPLYKKVLALREKNSSKT